MTWILLRVLCFVCHGTQSFKEAKHENKRIVFRASASFGTIPVDIDRALLFLEEFKAHETNETNSEHVEL